ncbi:MAG: hypothetical protein LBR34_08280 [Prevotella sp.]|jgi:hypothetical protein|nr:hypothetical protein [Prevotella sp.]
MNMTVYPENISAAMRFYNALNQRIIPLAGEPQTLNIQLITEFFLAAVCRLSADRQVRQTNPSPYRRGEKGGVNSRNLRNLCSACLARV